MNHDVKYDFTADLTGTGDRSEYEKYVNHRDSVLHNGVIHVRTKRCFTPASVKAR